MTREMPMSSGIILINSWDAIEYQWVTFVGLGYLLRVKCVVEKSALPTLLLWWTQMDVIPPVILIAGGQIFPLILSEPTMQLILLCEMHSPFMYCIMHLHKRQLAKQNLFHLVETSWLITHSVFITFYLLFITTNLGKRQVSIIVLWQQRMYLSGCTVWAGNLLLHKIMILGKLQWKRCWNIGFVKDASKGKFF